MGAELNKALAAVQAELTPIRRNAKGQTGTREHRYADLPAVYSYVLPLLSKHGLAFSARPTRAEDGTFVLAYSLLHASGEQLDGEYPLGAGTPQQLGSAITYARRYALCAAVGATPIGEDDDGAAAAEAHTARPRAARARHAATTGPDHDQLRAGTVERAPGDRPAQRAKAPADDEWTDQPATVSPVIKARSKAIVMRLEELEVHDREERLGITARLAGWPERKTLNSTNDLSRAQSERVMAQLADLAGHEELMALVTNGDAPKKVTT